MKRLAVIALAGWCALAPSIGEGAQALKERSLTDSPAAPAPATSAPAAQQAQPAEPATPAQTQPAAQSPAYQAPAYQPAPASPPASTSTGSQPPLPASQAGTPVNGQPVQAPPPPPPAPTPPPSKTFNRQEVDREVMGFFESGSRGLAELVARAFNDLGQPTGFIKGNEGGGALVVGFRYGTGTLYLKGQRPVTVYWQSPSLGFDFGVNAVKVFTLVYGMTRPDQVFQRFPGVDGSAYVLGGFGMNYQRSDQITLAPIRFGVGLRLGANVGYQHYTRTQEINPF